MALVWNAHHNVQKITQTAWSYYLLKYQMKCEPTGRLRLDDEAVKTLGLGHLTKAQRRLAAALCMTKPVPPSEAALMLLGIPVVQKSRTVHFLGTVPPMLRTRRVTKWGGVTRKPVDEYLNRPPELADVPCLPYLRRYLHTTKPRKDLFSMGKDATGSRFIYDRFRDAEGGDKECTEIIRFTDYHPKSQPEGFFYNLLLERLAFLDEAEILSPENKRQSYQTECVLRGFIKDETDLEVGQFILSVGQFILNPKP